MTDGSQHSLAVFEDPGLKDDLGRLGEIERADFRAVVLDGKSYRRQALARDVEPATVRKNVARARRKLGRHTWGNA